LFYPYIKEYLTYLPTPKRGIPKTYISRLLNSDQKTLEIDTEQLEISEPYKFYMACFKAATRSGACRVRKDGVKIILERTVCD
jgi:hypothetical protein